MKYHLVIKHLILLFCIFFNSFLSLKFKINYQNNFHTTNYIKNNNCNVLKFCFILPEQVRKKYKSCFISNFIDKENIKIKSKKVINKNNIENNNDNIKEDITQNVMCDIINDDVLTKNSFIKKSNNKLYILITSPEAARIYRYVIILLIYNMKNKNFKYKNCHEKKINYIKKYIQDIPILSIGYSCNNILKNKFNKSLFYNISNKNMSINKRQIFKIKKEEFLQINRDIKTHLNIVFTPTKANATIFKKELRDFLFLEKKNNETNTKVHKTKVKKKNINVNVNINRDKHINKQHVHKNILWISSSISTSSFNDLHIYSQNDNNIYNHINIKRINCYDTQKVTYNKNDRTNKIHIKKNSIICLMSSSTVLSFYENFGNNFSYVVCMGKNSYELLKKLNFKNIFFPENSKTETLLNILITLYNKLNNKYKHKYHIILTRQKDKNDEIKKILSQRNIPFQEIPCIKTKYNYDNISKLYEELQDYIEHTHKKKKRNKIKRKYNQ
ncbi:conserved Plasmodium protein, unknown function [Plasmodium sp. DRC-Itaito]|nr:conserved Plasmodium protein, unknown function [Plasmodium sp. DRC-Itaito]